MRPAGNYRIGIHAPRNAGKTCLFSCMYGLRHLLPDQITFDDEATLVYLRRLWDHFRQGKVPPATPMTRRLDLTWRLKSGEDLWDIHTSDYAGALAEPSADGNVRELRAEARAWFRSCDAVLIMVDCSAPDVQQLDAVELLLADLRRDRRGADRPLAVVLTKWDTQGAPSSDPKDEQERLQQYFAAHPVFERLHRQVGESGGRFALIPVSAFGRSGPAPGQAPPIDQMRPHNLLTPWKWALKQCDELAGIRGRSRRRSRWAASILTAVSLLSAGGGTYAWATHRADREFLALREYRLAHSEPASAGERRSQADRYISAWWSRTAPSLRELVQEWRQADDAAATEHAAAVARAAQQRRHDEDHRLLLAELDRFDRTGDDMAAHEACRRFLADHPGSPHADLVRTRQTRARNAWDRRAWADLQDHETRFVSTGNTQVMLARVREYLKVPNAEHRADAGRMLARYEEMWDREEYAGLLAQAQRGNDARNLEDVQRRASAYLASQRGVHAMAAAVGAWRDWFLGLQEERPYTIRVKSVSVPRRSSLDSVWGVDARVTLTVGDQTHSSAAYEGRAPTMNADLGPFSFRWGKPTRMVVRVENHFPLLANPELETVIEDDKFVLGRTNGTISMTCLKGKQVTVHLECPAVVPPSLPPYGAR